MEYVWARREMDIGFLVGAVTREEITCKLWPRMEG